MAYTISIEAGYAHIVLLGSLTVFEVIEATHELDKIEAERRFSYHRLVEISGVENLHLDFSAVHQFASGRRSVKLWNKVRTAVVAKTTVQYGIARMFQLLNAQPQTEVDVFRDTASALGWISERNEKVAG